MVALGLPELGLVEYFLIPQNICKVHWNAPFETFLQLCAVNAIRYPEQ